MPTDKTARSSRAEDRRRQLIAAAASLFADRGYPNVSVSDIAARAGVSTPTVYRHFADKQALLFAATQCAVDAFESQTEAALAAAGDPAQAVVAAATALGTSGTGQTALWRWSGQHLSDEQNREVVRRTRSVLRRWAAAIAQARPGLSERESMYLAGAVLSVSGSLIGRTSKSDLAAVNSAVRQLIWRLFELRPALAPPLTEHPAGLPGEGGRRDEILDAAAALFAARGYEGTGMDDIGAAVGITGPSVYKHFASKDAILVAISQRSSLRLQADALAASARTDRPAELLGLLVDSYVQTITGTPDLLVALISGYALQENPHAGELVAAQRRYVVRWIDLLQAVHPEMSRPCAALTVRAALAVVNDAVRMPRSTPRPEFAARMAYLVKGLLQA
ncbi:TetR/AcrR family transcriptional regulator [Gordonia sp. (in: high G+C Gram-positive bacteria)]|uniref:TetR/AcrR family transcriptional regulator n=1 Tax=unclassified Gordonia (in: high G+C Gram-positive bacteria) TaxID=2657482 RepID=UPI00352857EE